jgi:hypothetical protein
MILASNVNQADQQVFVYCPFWQGLEKFYKVNMLHKIDPAFFQLIYIS